MRWFFFFTVLFSWKNIYLNPSCFGSLFLGLICMTNAHLYSWNPTQGLEKCRKTTALWQGRKNKGAADGHSPKCDWESYWDKLILYQWETFLRERWELAVKYRSLSMLLWISSLRLDQNNPNSVWNAKKWIYPGLLCLSYWHSWHLKMCGGKDESLFPHQCCSAGGTWVQVAAQRAANVCWSPEHIALPFFSL